MLIASAMSVSPFLLVSALLVLTVLAATLACYYFL